MKICGFQKLTLTDYPGKVACIVFTGGCNFRCPFCHNAALVTRLETQEEYRQEDILDYLHKRKGIIDGVVVTGGEPLIHKDIDVFLRKIKNTGLCVKLDTNGTNPEKLRELIENGLVDYVAADIKNSREKYPLTTGINGVDLDALDRSIDILLSGKTDYEFRTTVVNELHTPEDIEKTAKRIQGAKKYFIQKFVDSGGIIGEELTPPDDDTLEEMRKRAEKYVPSVKIR